ncbi:MAG: hypothetical protein PHI06_01705 [Desulfobulbaceae bacterium]|nr:hypothetical protein [Desulfobulbaceae bacterium]
MPTYVATVLLQAEFQLEFGLTRLETHESSPDTINQVILKLRNIREK